MARGVKKTKLFDGKEFAFVEEFPFKVLAENAAIEARKIGFYARVVEGGKEITLKTIDPNATHWDLYVRMMNKQKRHRLFVKRTKMGEL